MARITPLESELFRSIYSENWIEGQARKACENQLKEEFIKPDEATSIRHHRMTIALAMPEREKHGL